MKKTALLLLVILFTGINVIAQLIARPLKEVAILTMPGENGSNGASVVWHPVLKRYFASFAGNAVYPLAIFDATGKRISPDGLETMLDIRGMWYNTVTKMIEANGYNDNGWISYKLDVRGIPEGIKQIKTGQVQPDPQSVGVFDAAKKRVCFLDGRKIVSFSLQGALAADVIELKYKNNPTEQPEGELEDNSKPVAEYNATTLCYTGIVNAEFAVLNYGEIQIELYNRKGILTKAFKLPEEMPLYTNFNFAYANGIWWMFDKGNRKWVGFK